MSQELRLRESAAPASGGAPFVEAQATITQIWIEILQRDNIAPTENFFDLGGDSLKALDVISRLQALLNVELPLIAFFEDPTVAHLAEVVEGLRSQHPSPSPITAEDADPSRASADTQAKIAGVWSDVLQRENIAPTENFFDLGGDSLKALEVISRLQAQLDVELPLIAFFEDPTIRHLTTIVQELLRNRSAALGLAPAAPHAAPLSFAQLQYWLLQQTDTPGYRYQETRVLRVRGELHADVLQRAFDLLCQRHQILATRFRHGVEEPVQVVDPGCRLQLERQDLTDLPAASREAAALEIARNERRRIFDLFADLPIRARLLRLGDEDHVLVVILHHVISDGYSSGILFPELAAIYDALLTGSTPALAEPALQYAEYAASERSQMQGERLEKELEYWRSNLDGAPPRLWLPADKQRGEQASYAGRALSVTVSQSTVEQLKELAHTTGSTLFTVLLGALRILLHHWTAQQDIVIGTVASNRSRGGTDRMIGCFVNFLPLRNRVTAEESALAVLGREKKVVMDAFAHQDCPFLKIVPAASSSRITDTNPIYNVALLLQNLPERIFPGRSFEADFIDLDIETALLDLRFVATQRVDGLVIECEFKTELFDAASIQNLLDGLRGILEDLARHPARRISDFAIPKHLAEQAEVARLRDQPYTIAITSTFTAEPVKPSLMFWTAEFGLRTEIKFAPYNQVFQQLLDPGSVISRNGSGVNVVLMRLTDWLRFEDGLPRAQQKEKLARIVRDFADTLSTRRWPVAICLCLCPPESRYSADPDWSEFLTHTEEALTADLSHTAGLHLIRSKEILDLYPVDNWEDPYADQVGHIPYTPDFFTALGTVLARRLFTLQSAPKKVIVLDCDNTLWKGVCGEEGPLGVCVDAPRRALQELMLAQSRAGMLLCLCSKNVEEDVDAVFTQNPGMVLRPEHIAARRVNWSSKPSNLRALAAELQLGLDSFIVIDDNPIECAEIAAQVPEVLTLPLPQDEDQIPVFLRNVWAFDRPEVTVEDAQRTAMYQQNAEREQLRKKSATLDEFLAGLELKVEIRPIEDADLSRVSQLTERTNQFNFTTIRRSETAVRQFLEQDGHGLAVNLSDRFGDYGLVGVVLFAFADSALVVETFLLSCRALGRKVEHHMLAQLGELAKARHLNHVITRLIPSKKNQPASDFLNKIGTTFRHPQEGHLLYCFPADYAADVLSQSAAELPPAESEVARSLPVSGASAVEAHNRLMLRIATQLFDVSHVARALQLQRLERDRHEDVFVPAGTPIEEMVAAAWTQVLKLDRVGVHENFFTAGGDSLLATQVVARVRQILGVELPLRAMFEAPTIAEFARRIEAARGSTLRLPSPVITKSLKRDPCPLSFAQQRLWFLDQLEPGNPLYNVSQMMRMRGKLDVTALHQSVNKMVERHETLRTTFAMHLSEPVQVIASELKLPLPIVDLSDLTESQREREAQKLAKEEAQRPFDLASGPVMRARLLRLQPDDHMLLLTMHHIVSDRWSLGLVAEELTAQYRALVENRPAAMRELAIQYADFSVWQRNWLQGEVLSEQLQYWKKQLAGAPQVLQFPTDRTRPSQMSMRGEIQSRTLPRNLLKKLLALSQNEGVTLFMTLLAGFQTLLARYTGQEDIVVGSPIAGRYFAELEHLIGFFVNTLVLRGNLSGDPSFHELLARTREVCLQAYAYQEIPFEKLVEELQPERNLSQNPIFQVLFALQNAPMQTLELPGLMLERAPVHPGTSMLDMSWFAIETPEGLLVRVEYSTDLFERSTISRALDHFAILLESAAIDPGQPISQLSLLGDDEKQKLLIEFNATQQDFPADKCVHQLLEEVATRIPSSIALICGSEQTTYGDLNWRANQLARYLRRLGVERETLVGLYIERSPDMLVALLGILKAGGAYVPLDPAYPKERIAFILEDAHTPILITQQSLLDSVPKGEARIVCMDADWDVISRESGDNLATLPSPRNLAYVLYTSGSTGKPKGVQIEHHSLLNFLLSVQQEPGVLETDRLLAVTTLSFDIAGLELCLPLIAGAEIVLATREQAADGVRLLALLQETAPTVMQATPATWRMLIDAGWAGSPSLKVLCGGEALPSDLAAQLLPRCAELWNMYGPTETTIWSSVYRVCGGFNGTAPIGRPMANTTMYVLDAQLQPVPQGVTGELHIGGEGLARGYLNRPELTAEKFVPDPFSGKSGARLYRTGDLARFLEDGNLQCLGRTDFQVKVRGFRIELGEIESTLALHPGVRQAVVTAHEDQAGDKRLVAYVVPQSGQSLAMAELRAHLKQSLADYMIPSALVELDSLPLTPNGKVDRKRLPVPDYPKSRPEADSLKPRTPSEEILSGIWAEVLHQEQIGIEDDFFELGGHSLLATQVISRFRHAFQIELPLRALFEAPTIAALAGRVEHIARQKGTVLVPSLARVPRDAALPQSFAQQRLWFLDQLEPDTPAYNIAYTLHITGSLDTDLLEQSLGVIAERHESLRTSFSSVAEQPVQIIHDSISVPFNVVDLTSMDARARETEARRLIAEDANRPFDLSQAPLMRVSLVRLSTEEHYLLINIHHIISDRWSVGLICQELLALYEAGIQGRTADVPPLPLQYADYAAWQRESLSGDALAGQLAYWREKLQGAPSLLELPTDRPRPAKESYYGDAVYISFSAELWKKLKKLSRQHGATQFMTLLAGFLALLSRYSGQDDLVVGTAVANRSHPDLEKVAGYFVNTLALRTDLSGDPRFSELLARVKETSLGAYAHQDLPFEKIVEDLNPERNLSHSPLVQVFFVLQNAPVEALDSHVLKLAHIPSGLKTVKGDMFLSLHEAGDGLEGRLEYSTDLFDRSTVTRMLEHYRVLLEAAVQDPDLRLNQLPLVTQDERKQIVLDWNDTARDFSRDACVHELFEQMAQRSPQSIACVQPGGTAAEGRQITYLELNQSANQLARVLRKRGAGPGTRIGIFLERSLEMMIGLLGTQKSGSAYVPLDPAYPPERIRLTMEDAQPLVVITQESLVAKLPEHHADLLCIDRDWPGIARENTANLDKIASSDDLVYVIFTSGSTGRPKGVQVPHRAVVNLLTFMASELDMGESDVFPALASFAFDMCIPELYLALITGGRVVIGDKDLASNGEELAALLRASGATIVHATPTTWRLLLEAGFTGKGLKRVIGAEPVPRELCHRLLLADPSLYNFYGPTETTVWSTFHHFRMPDEPVVVGRPIANTQIYILDQLLQPVPAGIYGEIYIAGEGVTDGYLNRPELTAEKFVQDRFASRPGARMYRTGDRARFLADGRIEFQGRSDYQVKLRGYRIELGEIEAILDQHPAVKQSVVIAREDVVGDKRLVAYVVANAGAKINSAELREFVQARLPDYMIPAAWVELAVMPLSPNGKADRKNLPMPEYMRPELSGYAAPRTPQEELIAGIWSEVLNFQQVGIHDDFFALGGHSLLATQVVSRIRQAFQLELPLRALFEAPTVAGLADRVAGLARKRAGTEAPPLRRAPRSGYIPLSLAQQRLWFLDQLEPGNPLYNVAYVSRVLGPLDIEVLERSLNAVVRRHESLRTSFPSVNDVPVQVIGPSVELKVEVADVTHLAAMEARESEARQLATREMQRSFDLAKGPLLRALVVRIADEDHALILNTHHIISDRWSLAVLLQEVSALYEADLQGKPSSLPDLPIQYADYAVWQREFLSGSVLHEQLAYWREQLDGAPAVLEIPTDRPRQGVQQFWGAMHRQPIPQALSSKVQALSRAQRGTVFMTLLAAFQLLMGWLAGKDDIVVGTDFANRNQVDTEKLIGFFVNLLPIRGRLSPERSFTQFLEQVRETSLGAMAHQDIPFDKLVEELRPERNLTHNPLVQVLFVMQNTPRLTTEFGGLKLSPLGVGSSSRFDLVLFIYNLESTPLAIWVYNPNLFDASRVARMADRFEFILQQVCADPAIKLESLFESLEDAEQQQRGAQQKRFEEAGLQKLKKARRKAAADVVTKEHQSNM